MGYFHECPSCTKVVPVGHLIDCVAESEADIPDRQCDRCGADGCVDCLPDALCSSCQHEVDTEAEMDRVMVWDSDTWTLQEGADGYPGDVD